MAAGDPIKLGSLTTNPVFLITAVTGLIVESYRESHSSKKLEQYNAATGYTDGAIYHDFMRTFTIQGKVNGTTGAAAATVGATVTDGNASTTHGVATGGNYVDTVEISHQAEQLRDLTVNGTQRAGIT